MALLAAVRTDFGGFASLLDRTQKRLRQATETIESAQRHSETIARKLGDVGELPGAPAHAMLAQDSVEDSNLFDDDNWD